MRGPTEKKCLFSMLKKACLDSPSLTGHTHKRKGSLWGTSHVQAAARRVLRTLLYKGSRRDKRSSCLEGLFRKGGFFVRGTGSPFFSQRGRRPGGAEQEPLGKLLTEGIPAGLGAIPGKGVLPFSPARKLGRRARPLRFPILRRHLCLPEKAGKRPFASKIPLWGIVRWEDSFLLLRLCGSRLHRKGFPAL